jgi:uncharacterized membrane protein SirB2
MQGTRLEFHPLTFVEERDGVLVGRADIESYAVLPTDGVALLNQLSGGVSAEDAATWYEATFGEPIDIMDFVSTLYELGFIRVDGQQATEPERVRYQLLGRLVFSPGAWIVYAAVIVMGVIAMISRPGLRPSTHHVFFCSSLVVIQIVVALVQMPVSLWHEWFHVLAGRRLGLPTRLGVGRRLYFFVFETHLNGLLGVPRSKRYLPFLAGMLADILLFSGLTLTAIAADGLHGAFSWVGKLALAIAYLILLRLAWQFYLFLRTDLYYVFVTACGCTDLHGATSAYLRARVARLIRLSHLDKLAPVTWIPGWPRLPGLGSVPVDDTDWSPRDRAVAPWFALITLVGTGFLIAGVVFAVVPVLVEFVQRIADGLAGGAVDTSRFWDAAVTLMMAIIQFGVLPIAAGRRSRATSR